MQIFFISFLTLAYSNQCSSINLVFKSVEWIQMILTEWIFHEWSSFSDAWMFWPRWESNPGLLEIDRWSHRYHFAIETSICKLNANYNLISGTCLLGNHNRSFYNNLRFCKVQNLQQMLQSFQRQQQSRTHCNGNHGKYLRDGNSSGNFSSFNCQKFNSKVYLSNNSTCTKRL